MDYTQIEKKWQKKWAEHKCHSFNKANADNKYYVLEMFSYPSGANLHIGHWYNYAPSDTFARYKKMKGYEVFQPMGFDAFGLPAENFAIKTGTHPRESTVKSIATMQRQLNEMGAMFNFDAKVITCFPEYYSFTQWLFLEFYKNGLIYMAEAPVNFCTSCNTAIANEQVNDGVCERCGSEVVRKNMSQWFFKITAYAEELLTSLDSLDWPERTKAMQRNWIGKSVGGEIVFKVHTCECDNTPSNADTCKCDCVNTKTNADMSITVFTTRADTLFGATYVVLAPDHSLVERLTTPTQRKQVEKYRYKTSKLSDIERLSDKNEKTGVFTGSYCINPLTGEQIPIFIADYCLATYGTGAVMGVAAHDKRDYDFAQKYGLPIKKVIECDKLPYTDDGILVDSGSFSGLSSSDARNRILDTLEKTKQGTKKTNYRLRDWSVSRQRYWGTPIPIIHCKHCGAVPAQIPVLLPDDVTFRADGKSPLATSKSFLNTTCPKCGQKALREVDTLDGFVCSSWYFLRYADNLNTTAAFDKNVINKMLPVDKYIGGAEHACMHLLYSRFFVKALRDMGHLDFSEPFTSLVHQGTILGPDGEKMSKSKNNVVNPDEYTHEYGADVLRMYLMFGFSYIDGGPWNSDGIKAVHKFMERCERIIEQAISYKGADDMSDCVQNSELEYILNNTIKEINKDIEVFSFNTCIARLMELVNGMYKLVTASEYSKSLLKRVGVELIKLIAPFAPHFAEEMNERYRSSCGHTEFASIFNERYPTADESKLRRSTVELAVQINSKIVSRLEVDSTLDDEGIISQVKAECSAVIAGRPIKKAIVIKGRLVNLIV